MSCNIECEWMRTKRIVINPDGQVWPCCYLANSAFMYTSLGRPTSYTPKETLGIEDQLIDVEEAACNTGYQVVLQEYLTDQDDYNIFKHSIEEIVQSKWFAKTLPESWNEEERALHQCKVHCSKTAN